jgi:hypothetical protein
MQGTSFGGQGNDRLGQEEGYRTGAVGNRSKHRMHESFMWQIGMPTWTKGRKQCTLYRDSTGTQ